MTFAYRSTADNMSELDTIRRWPLFNMDNIAAENKLVDLIFDSLRELQQR